MREGYHTCNVGYHTLAMREGYHTFNVGYHTLG